MPDPERITLTSGVPDRVTVRKAGRGVRVDTLEPGYRIDWDTGEIIAPRRDGRRGWWRQVARRVRLRG